MRGGQHNVPLRRRDGCGVTAATCGLYSMKGDASNVASARIGQPVRLIKRIDRYAQKGWSGDVIPHLVAIDVHIYDQSIE
jgi:hypothetical protein